MKSKINKYFKEFFLFVILFFVMGTLVSLYKTSQMKIQDGVCKRDTDIIYFWAVWCPVCKVTSPNVERVSRHFDVVGIAVRSGSVEKVNEYMQKYELHFKNINDPDAKIASENGVNVFPTIVFCKDGHVKLAEAGYMSSFGVWLRAWFFSL